MTDHSKRVLTRRAFLDALKLPSGFLTPLANGLVEDPLAVGDLVQIEDEGESYHTKVSRIVMTHNKAEILLIETSSSHGEHPIQMRLSIPVTPLH